MSFRVVFSPEAQEQLVELYRYIAEAASPETAARYTAAIVSYCESLRTFPHRGTMRDDVRPGLRVTNYKKRSGNVGPTHCWPTICAAGPPSRMPIALNCSGGWSSTQP